MKDLLLRRHGKRWRFFRMEGAEAYKIFAHLFEVNIKGYNFYKIETSAYFFNDLIRNICHPVDLRIPSGLSKKPHPGKRRGIRPSS
jgi:hypothetical protein